MWRYIVVFVAVLAASSTSAQPRRLSDAIALLDSPNSEEVQHGLEKLGEIGTAAIVPPLVQRIRRGLPFPLLIIAIETLALSGRREAGPILFELMSHRRLDVRVASIGAAIACRPRGVGEALVSMLNDSQPRVRSSAALGLGQLGDPSHIDTLFHAFDRGILESATSIGQLARPADVQRFLSYLGRVPFDNLIPGLNEITNRSDVPQRVLLEIVAQVGELATDEVATYLDEWAETLPANSVRNAIEEIVRQIRSEE